MAKRSVKRNSRVQKPRELDTFSANAVIEAAYLNNGRAYTKELLDEIQNGCKSLGSTISGLEVIQLCNMVSDKLYSPIDESDNPAIVEVRGNAVSLVELLLEIEKLERHHEIGRSSDLTRQFALDVHLAAKRFGLELADEFEAVRVWRDVGEKVQNAKKNSSIVLT